MYPSVLPDAEKYHWMYRDVFDAHSMRIIKTYIHYNYSGNMHIHDFYEINLVLHGSGRHYFEDRSFDISEGDVFVIPKGCRHGYAFEDQQLDVFHFLLHERLLERFSAELMQLPGFVMLFTVAPKIRGSGLLHLTPQQMSSLIPVLEKLNEYNYQAETADALIHSLALYAVSYLCVCFQRQYKLCAGASGSFDRLAACIEYINVKYPENITAKQLAREAAVSQSTLLRLFKRYVGKTPSQYIQDVRLGSAKRELLQSDKSVAEIAVDCGFYDCAHFIRAFEAREGISPGRLRNNT